MAAEREAAASGDVQKGALANTISVHDGEAAQDHHLFHAEQVQQNAPGFFRIGRTETQVDDAGGNQGTEPIDEFPEVTVEGDEHLPLLPGVSQNVRVCTSGSNLSNGLNVETGRSEQADARRWYVFVREKTHQRASGTA